MITTLFQTNGNPLSLMGGRNILINGLPTLRAPSDLEGCYLKSESTMLEIFKKLIPLVQK